MGADLTPDDQLLTRIAGGDAEAFSALFRRRQGDVYRFALHMTGRPAVADDVTQDTFLAVMRDAGRYEASRATVVAWLCGIARHHVLRRFERERPLQALDVDEDAVNGEAPLMVHDVLGDLTRAEEADAVREAVMTLPIRYREAVALCDLQELSYADAAAALGCAVGTVRSRLHRGRTLLAAKLAALEPGLQRNEPSAENLEPAAADAARSERPAEFARGARVVRRLA
jgi:RNA polymerase sigma-70 factor (ECF subfamily)